VKIIIICRYVWVTTEDVCGAGTHTNYRFTSQTT